MRRNVHRQVLIASLAVVLSGLFSSCSSAKKLTESSARSLLQDSVADKYDPVPLSPILSLFAKTRVDYKSFSGDGPGQVLKGLLDKGLVEQRSETISYPNMTGTYSGEIPILQIMKYDPKCVRKITYTFEMVPDSNAYRGTSISGSSCSNGVVDQYPAKQAISGTVSSDGSVAFSGSNPGKYEEQGDKATITMPSPSYMGPTWQLSGRASSQHIELKWYTYSFTPDAQKLIENAPNGIEARAGKIKIGDVTDLQLVTETDAIAHFAWEGSMNDFGKILTSNNGDRGTGEVEFRKKPDGTWFVSRWALR